MTDDHEHVFEPTFRLSRITGTPHRRCLIDGCSFITLDAEFDPDAYYVVGYRTNTVLADISAPMDLDSAIHIAAAQAAKGEEGVRYVVEDDDGQRMWPE